MFGYYCVRNFVNLIKFLLKNNITALILKLFYWHWIFIFLSIWRQETYSLSMRLRGTSFLICVIGYMNHKYAVISVITNQWPSVLSLPVVVITVLNKGLKAKQSDHITIWKFVSAEQMCKVTEYFWRCRIAKMDQKDYPNSIKLPETIEAFRNLKNAKRFAIDIGRIRPF